MNRFIIAYVTTGVLVFILASILSGCYRTENGLVLGLPDYEKREITVTPIDLEILLRANALLKDERI